MAEPVQGTTQKQRKILDLIMTGTGWFAESANTLIHEFYLD